MMKRMVTWLMVGALMLLGTLLLMPVASAANLIPECSNGNSTDLSTNSVCSDVKDTTQTTSDNKFYGPNGVLTKAAGLITWVGGVAAVIMIILGGFTFVTGSGDPNTLSAAKKTVLYAVVGLVVLVLPSAIIRLVISKL